MQLLVSFDVSGCSEHERRGGVLSANDKRLVLPYFTFKTN